MIVKHRLILSLRSRRRVRGSVRKMSRIKK